MAFLAPAATTGFLASGAAGGASLAAASTTSTLLGTLGSIYTAMQPVLTAVSIAAPFIAAGSTAAMAAQQMALANQQATLTEYEVKNMEQAAMLRSSERKRRMRSAVGQQLALFSASGVDPLKGTPVDVMSDTAQEFAYEDFADAFETQGKVYSGMIKAKNLRAYGKQQATATLLDYGTRWAMRG
jgi:hypothetical protein